MSTEKDERISVILTDIAITLKNQGIKDDKYFSILKLVRKELEK